MTNADLNLYRWHRRYTEALIAQYFVAMERAQEQEDERFAATAKRKRKAVLKLPELAARRAIRQLRNARALAVESLGSFDLKVATSAEVRGAIDVALNEWRVEFAAEVDAFIGAGFEQGRNLIMDPINKARLRTGVSSLIQFSELDDLKAIGRTFSAKLANEVASNISSTVGLGLLGGESRTAITKKIGRVVTKGTVFGVAKGNAVKMFKAETMRAINVGADVQAGDIVDTFARTAQETPELKKFWKHSGKSNPRAHHIALEQATNPGLAGIPLKMDAKFNVRGTMAAGPHAPNLPPSETLGCGCTVAFVLDEEKETQNDPGTFKSFGILGSG